MSVALSRRSALRGSVAASLGLAIPTMAVAGKRPSTADARLVAIAAELVDIDARANASDVDTPEYDALIDRYSPLEAEMAALPADTLVGLAAKARVSRIPAVAGCVNDVESSVIDDLLRLHAAGKLS